MIRQDPAYNIKYVQQNVKDTFGFDISYHKAWHALKAAREEVYGTRESYVQKLPKFMTALQKSNPGTVVEWLHLDTDIPGTKILNYVFWTFRPCIEGFRYCHNLISIVGTHLYTKYKHKLLVAVTLDANQQILLIAFALVDEESLASWRWFLEMLAKYLMLDDDDRICLISDRHNELINAINFVLAFTFPRGVHHFCLRHICLNFNTKYKNIRLKDLCWRTGAEQNVRKFERIMEEIRGLNEEAFDWLQRIDKAQWTSSHDGGWRTDCLRHDRVKPCITSYKSLITLNNLLLLQQEACRHFGVNASNFIPSYYDIQAFKKTYIGRFAPVWGEEDWDDVDFVLVHNPTRRARRGPG
ncbi:UNVERIFIED_CONTAM: hypothetical protein Sradi_4384300 [Sesamum radiatum]|uniref:MULE transposase domain-containing protein n=1 Tax=Sesamum radiatum TaxID=300843 RepID=A0AAW2NPV6_SESRA